MTTLEICAETMADVRAACAGGADRIELCSALAVGGLSPARSTVAAAVALGVPVHVLVRLQPGGFVVDPDMVAQIACEIEAVRAIGAAGVVVGALKLDGRLDVPALSRWRKSAGAMDLTLHRAVDLATSPVAAVVDAIRLGVDRILTSGGAVSAPAGASIIAEMVAAANGPIEIMAGAGVTPGNVAALLRVTGVTAIHASASVGERWSDPRIPQMGFGPAERRRTSTERVRMLKATIAQACA